MMDGTSADILAARAKLKEKFGDSNGRIGGKGTARIKKKPALHKSPGGEDKKLQATIKRMGLSSLPGVDEAAMIRADGSALCIDHPKIQAAINANTFIITGATAEKRLEDIFSLPSDINPEMLQKFAAEWQKLQESGAAVKKPAEDDDEVPDLVADFEEVAAQ